AAQSTLQSFLSWQSCLAAVDPLGTALHASSALDLFHISGHRDGCNTECPGDAFYPLLAGIRQGVNKFINTNCATTSTSAEPFNGQLNVFPNPSSGLIQLEYLFPEAGQLSVINALGQSIWQQNISAVGSLQVDLSGQPAGNYTLQVLVGEKRIYEKIILQ
ncbi:MAG: T9SS type A sorting domain-containing protein, partial [Bacteroidota bacterium]